MTRRRPTFICLPDTTLRITNQQCPAAATHTPHPLGYIAESEWAEEMRETHEQRRCAECGEWEIWRAKERHGVTPAVTPSVTTNKENR